MDMTTVTSPSFELVSLNHRLRTLGIAPYQYKYPSPAIVATNTTHMRNALQMVNGMSLCLWFAMYEPRQECLQKHQQATQR